MIGKIHFGHFVFELKGLVGDWDPSSSKGVYAITYIPDPVNEPNDHTPLYFGQTKNFDNRQIGPGHDGYDCAKRLIGDKPLYISIYEVSTEHIRNHIEDLLIANNDPPCNKTNSTHSA